jgi:hypothetical protein
MKRMFVLILAVAMAAGFAAASHVRSVAASSPRSGVLHVAKECSAYTGLAGSFCTITSSNLNAIDVGSRIVYAQAAGAASLDSDIVLDTGHGNNTASGHVTLDFASGSGLVTFSGGTGRFTGFQASAVVSFDPATGLWHWDGAYSFSPSGDKQ